METYCKVGVSKYWIVDWRKKSVEIYMFDYKADGTPYSYLFKVVTEKNKDKLGLVTTFAPLFFRVSNLKNSPVLKAMKARAMSAIKSMPETTPLGTRFRQ